MPDVPLGKVQKLKLLTQLAEHFSDTSYALIDAALEAFGVTPLNTWDDNQSSYVVYLLKNAPDETLVGLGEYAGLIHTESIVEEVHSSTENGQRKFKRFRLFISHLAKNKNEAAALSADFKKFGISGFVAHADIKPTVEWMTEIERRLSRCDALIALLHDGFKDSDWTEQEVGWVLGRRRPVFAIRYNLAPYGFFGKSQAFNGNGKTSSALAKEIFRRLAEHTETQASISHALVGYFTESDSFVQAKERVERLFSLTYWDDELRQKLESAVSENSQISSSFGVPDRVKILLAQS